MTPQVTDAAKRVKVSDYIIARLPALTGARHVFLLSGGNLMHLLDSLGRSAELTAVPMHHEQAAGIAADAYGRTRGCVGVCFVTSGPGATNAVTAITGAWLESTPVLFISGQVSRANGRGSLALRQRGIQEVDIVTLAASITKYASRVDDPAEVPAQLARAVALARAGRPGPVLLDIPLDVQGANIEVAAGAVEATAAARAASPVQEEAVDKLLDLLDAAERPMLILGGGLRTAGLAQAAERLVARLGMPVQTSWNGMDLIAEDHPLFFGRAGVFAARYANLLIQSADLLLVLGARLGMQHTGYSVAAFARGARKIMVDMDAAEMAKPGLAIDLPIEADLRDFLPVLARALDSRPLARAAAWAPWLAHCWQLRDRYPPVPLEPARTDYVEPFRFVRRLSAFLPADAVVPFGSSGMPHTVSGAIYAVRKGQRVFTSKGLAAMGYGLPSAVGAAFAAPGRSVVTLLGEGGLQLNLQALQTIAHWRLPIKVFVLNNGGYHSIHMTQKGYFQGHFVASGPESGVSFPPLAGLAELHGFAYRRIANDLEVDDQLAALAGESGPLFCEVMIDPEQPLLPKLASYARPDGTMMSRPLEDMLPLLSRDELRAAMLVPIVDVESS